MSQARGFIDDDYYVDDVIQAVEGIHEAVHYTFRPCSQDEVARFGRNVTAQRSDKEADRLGYEMLTKHIRLWDLQNPKTNESVDVTAQNMKKLHPVLFKSLLNRVTGLEPIQDDGSSVEEQLEADEKN